MINQLTLYGANTFLCTQLTHTKIPSRVSIVKNPIMWLSQIFFLDEHHIVLNSYILVWVASNLAARRYLNTYKSI